MQCFGPLTLILMNGDGAMYSSYERSTGFLGFWVYATHSKNSSRMVAETEVNGGNVCSSKLYICLTFTFVLVVTIF